MEKKPGRVILCTKRVLASPELPGHELSGRLLQKVVPQLMKYYLADAYSPRIGGKILLIPSRKSVETEWKSFGCSLWERRVHHSNMLGT